MMAAIELWLLILGIGIVTFATRLSFIVLLRAETISPRLARALSLVPPAALSAIIVPELLLRDGNFAIGLDNPRLLAGLLAIGVAWRTRSILLTLGSGLLALLLLQVWLG